jgi:S1-C subfamily serine protease
VVNIRAGSMANAFGILKDDVILAINDVPVTRQSQAVSVVKRELKKKPTPRYITVRILRHGKTIVKRFDTRDPETRRRARKAFR